MREDAARASVFPRISDIQEKSVLRWGGLAGILGAFVVILVPIVGFGFAPTGAGSGVVRFPDIQAAVTVESELFLLSDILLLALFLAVYMSLRRTSLAPALLGTALGVLGLGVLFTETQTQIAYGRISDLYHAPGATAVQQSTLTLIYQVVQSVFFELDVSGGLLLSIGMVLLGLAMIRTQAFGRTLGWASVVLGGASVAGVSSIQFLGESLIPAALTIPVYVVLPIIWGWKVYHLSKVG